MNTQTKPSAGALRAAKALTVIDWINSRPNDIAQIIDLESGLAELAKAAEAMLGIHNPPAGEPNHIDFAQAADMLQEALNKVRNPNAGVTQPFPKGRWDMSLNDKIVLAAAVGLKSFARFTEANEVTGITKEQWEATKASLAERKLLNKAGAATDAGRNAISGWQLGSKYSNEPLRQVSY